MAKELVGWKEIADRLGVTVRAAQRYAAFERDPLPCYRRLRSVRIDPIELDGWLDRHRQPLGSTTHADRAPVVLVPADARLAPLLRLVHHAALSVLERAVLAGALETDELLAEEHFPPAAEPVEALRETRGRRTP